MRVCVIGANGQLGSDVCAIYHKRGHDVTGLNHDAVEVASHRSCSAALQDAAAELVINTAAIHDLESCERDPARAFAVNAIGPRNLALLSNELGFILVHVSTDYVFDGSHSVPYTELDCPLPLNVYGNSKLSGEHFVRTLAKRYFVVRVSGLFGKNPCRGKGGLNFVNRMLNLAEESGEVRVVDNERLSPTYTVSLAEQLERLTESGRFGLYHATSQGDCSWYEFAAAIFELSQVPVTLSVAEPSEFPAKAPRPDFSVLENRALANARLDCMRHWRTALERYLLR